MTAMEGIIVALVGLGILIIGSVSFVYPLPVLTTNKRRGWTGVVGYLVLFYGSTIIRQTVPEELREPFASPLLALVIFGAFILSCIAIIRPLPQLWLSTRKRAGYVCILSFGFMLVAARLSPEPPPPTPEELAAQAAEEKKRKAEEEAERKAAERERVYQEVEERREAIRDWGADHLIAAENRCDEHIEQLAQYDFEWTTRFADRRIFSGWIGQDPENPSQMFPPITESTILIYTGDKIRFQNRYGAFRHYTYTCHYHPESETALKVSASPAK